MNLNSKSEFILSHPSLTFFNKELHTYVENLSENHSKWSYSIIESIKYSLFSGGKRFRPLLGLFLAEDLNVECQKLIPWLIAVEMVHTYSLIHDDLPILDNDDYRRGQLTNHKVFGEPIALLAGDALASEPFYIIAKHYDKTPDIALTLIQELALAMGVKGMVKGQSIDMASKINPLSENETLEMHKLKTGALIKVTLFGSALILGIPNDKLTNFKLLGEIIGLSFQIKDDLLDSAELIEAGSLPSLIGKDLTQQLLDQLTTDGLTLLEKLELKSSLLSQLLVYNHSRSH